MWGRSDLQLALKVQYDVLWKKSKNEARISREVMTFTVIFENAAKIRIFCGASS